MKELSIEEKAKAYDKALEAIKSLQEVNPSDEGIQNWINENFPELKESEDERIMGNIIATIHLYYGEPLEDEAKEMVAWLEKQPKDSPVHSNSTNIGKVEQKQEWSEEDENRFNNLIFLVEHSDENKATKEGFIKFINKLKSIRPQSQWKPSEEMLEALYRAIPENVMEISEDEMLLDKLYQGLKYGKVLSKK